MENKLIAIQRPFSVICSLAVLSLSFINLSCKKTSKIHHISVQVKEQIDPSFLKANDIKSHSAYQDMYFTTEATTLKGHAINLGSAIKKKTFLPKKDGEFQLHLELFAKIKEPTTIRLYQNSSLMADKQISKNQHVIFQAAVSLSKTDKITLSAKGKGVLVVGDLALFRETPPKERNYIFLICADTLRADHLQIYGYGRKTSPRIDAFAQDSVVFNNAYAQAPWTLPSHMSLFTALYEFNHGIKRGTIISPNIRYLIEELSQRFATRSFNGGIYVSSNFGFFRGFDLFKSIPQDQYSPEATKKLFNLARNDLKRTSFPAAFYFLHTYQTHSPYNPPLNHLKKFNPSPKYTYLSAPTVGSNHKDQYKKLPPEMVEAYIDLYDAEIFVFDLWFGKFLDDLKKRNIYDNSMIIFMSDHGEEFFDHKGWGHTHSLYNEIIRVPLIIKFPNNQFKGKRLETEVGLIDIMPFILNFYNISFDKKAIDGTDLMSVIKGDRRNRILISSLTSGFYIPCLPFKISRIERQQKIIFNQPYTEETLAFFRTPPPSYSQFEYYDLFRDPGEKTNIHESRIADIRRYRELFELITQKGRENLAAKDKPAEFDKNLIEALKSLGYVH
jgi:choline-sulfatase